MEPLAHTLVGACLGETGLKRRTPLAMAALVVGAMMPDVEGVCYLAGQDVAFEFRRGLTHGIAAMAVLPLALTGLLLIYDRWWRRKRHPDAPPARPAWLLGLAFIGVLTHPFLDWTNNYGVRLLMPFSGRWFYGDALFIVDPWPRRAHGS
jgi:inner membrane protein